MGSCFAQEKAAFSGAVHDGGGKPLEGANIILYPEDRTIPPSFAVSDGSGEFSVRVTKDVDYDLNITFMGFASIREDIIFTGELNRRTFVLREALTELQEVVINYTPPIIIKKDTTTYKVEAFVSGRERKLGEVLKKLPGVSVNREGEVFFKNRKVETVLVEDRTFFTGQPKMATKNIPADVIAEVQMMEDYNETPFLKEFENSDQLVMNLKLKEGRDHFLFGDIQASMGHRDRYRFHPSVFKYSPTTVHNFIGDVNNTPSRSFTLSDYISMEGERDARGILAAYNSPIASFLQQNDFYRNDHYFGGYNFQFNPDRVHELRIFGLGLMDRSWKRQVDTYTYQVSQVGEQRINQFSNRNGMLYAKLKYRYTPDLYTVFKFDASMDLMDLGSDGSNRTVLQGEQRDYTSLKDMESQRFGVNASLEKWFSPKNVSTAELHFSHSGESTQNGWNSPLNIFAQAIPLAPSQTYHVIDGGSGRNTGVELGLKHHYRPWRTHRLSFGLDLKLHGTSMENRAIQRINASGGVALDGFFNDFSSLLSEVSSSLTHTWVLNKTLNVDFGAILRNLMWKDRNPLVDRTHTTNRLLPLAKIEWTFDEKRSLTLSYNTSSSIPGPDSRIAGRRVLDFNRISEGNPYLIQSRTHRALLSLSLFKAYGFSFYSRLGYRKHRDPLVQRIGFQGIEGVVSPVQPDAAVNSYDISLRGRYSGRDWKVSFENSYYIRESISIFNGDQRFNNSFNVNNILRFSTSFEGLPNVEFEALNSFYRYSNPFFINATVDTDLNLAASYGHGNWNYECSVLQNFYVNRSQSTNSYFNSIGAKVFYHKEDSPLEVGIEIHNAGNNVSKISSLYNSVYFAQYKKRVFPRTMLLTLNYKL